MLRISPFRGIRFDWARIPLESVLCPPYDVIPPKMAKRLRRINHNPIHIELPAGDTDARYRKAVRIWRRWQREKAVIQDPPSFYIVEQRFRIGRRRLRRTGILAALGLDPASFRRVIPHERTLSKPRLDRSKLLAALRINTSPVFALYPDPRGIVRKVLTRITRSRPDARGAAPDGVEVRVWRINGPRDVRALRSPFGKKKLLVADGHHRLAAAKRGGADSALCFLCADEDPGLVVLPTHRVLRDEPGIRRLLPRLCRIKRLPSLAGLDRALSRHPSPFAFAIASAEGFELAVPLQKTTGSVRSRLAVEWLALRLLPGVDPHDIRYTHDSTEAAALARAAGGLAILVKPVPLRGMRRAVARGGPLPQKSTYFYPKIGAGIVFKEAFVQGPRTS